MANCSEPRRTAESNAVTARPPTKRRVECLRHRVAEHLRLPSSTNDDAVPANVAVRAGLAAVSGGSQRSWVRLAFRPGAR
jgi:hypothetical protein